MRDYDAYYQYRKDRHVIIYVHTSIYDIIIGYLVCIMYDIPIVGIGKKELLTIPIFGTLIKCINMIFIDRKINTAQYISDELNKQKNFAFVIAPRLKTLRNLVGTRNIVDDIESGFHFIAFKTQAHLHIAKLDYSNQTVTVDELVSDIIIRTSNYDYIINLVIEEIKKEKPYHPEKYHLIKNKSIKTSLINIKRSWILYIPILTVLYIMFITLYTYFI